MTMYDKRCDFCSMTFKEVAGKTNGFRSNFGGATICYDCIILMSCHMTKQLKEVNDDLMSKAAIKDNLSEFISFIRKREVE